VIDLRRLVIESNPDIERQPAVYFPVVLQIEFREAVRIDREGEVSRKRTSRRWLTGLFPLW
jgi:hypothetical protein